MVLEISLYDIDEIMCPRELTANDRPRLAGDIRTSIKLVFNTVRKTDDILEAEQMFMDEFTEH